MAVARFTAPVQVALIAIMCSSTLRRKHPYNILALFAFTCIMSVLVGTICRQVWEHVQAGNQQPVPKTFGWGACSLGQCGARLVAQCINTLTPPTLACCSYWDVSVVLIATATTTAAVAGLTLVAVFGKVGHSWLSLVVGVGSTGWAGTMGNSRPLHHCVLLAITLPLLQLSVLMIAERSGWSLPPPDACMRTLHFILPTRTSASAV